MDWAPGSQSKPINGVARDLGQEEELSNRYLHDDLIEAGFCLDSGDRAGQHVVQAES